MNVTSRFVTCLALIGITSVVHSQSAPPKPTLRTPKLIHSRAKSADIRARTNSHFEGYKCPLIVAFDVDEQGTVHNSKIKRSSGSRAADDLTLNWAHHLKYKPRAGCGTLESQAVVIIDFTTP